MAKQPLDDHPLSPAPVVQKVVVSNLESAQLVDKKPSLQIRSVKPVEIEKALHLLFNSGPGHSQRQMEQVRLFKKLAKQENYDLTRQKIVAHGNDILQAACFVPNDSGTAFIFSSKPTDEFLSFDQHDQLYHTMLSEISRWAFNSGMKFLQLLIDPQDAIHTKLIQGSDFNELTDLIYLYRLSRSAVTMPEVETRYDIINYSDASHPIFKEVIANTYQDSLDCPELENMRDMEDVITSHKAAGHFDPSLWKIFTVDGTPAAVLILSPLKNNPSVELTYMGVCKEFRGKGLGRHLLCETIQATRNAGLEGISLAVDCRNKPAMDLYTFFGFREIFQRKVFIQTK